MTRLSFYKSFRIFLFLFFIPALPAIAQETNIYNQMLRESLKPDFMKITMPLEMDSSIYNIPLLNEINKENIYRIIFRHRIEFLLPKENIFHLEDKKQTQISPYAMLFFYTNAKNEPWDNGKFNGDGSFSGEFATKGDVLLSKTSHVMVSIPGLLIFLATQTGILPAENLNTPRESKKDKMLRTIKNDVYHIED